MIKRSDIEHQVGVLGTKSKLQIKFGSVKPSSILRDITESEPETAEWQKRSIEKNTDEIMKRIYGELIEDFALLRREIYAVVDHRPLVIDQLLDRINTHLKG